ncbi:hypothetical protein evm_008344 [Chilo suppressalis]|nr:hypothetical protein evm_008344 [Chilo suppressalis]
MDTERHGTFRSVINNFIEKRSSTEIAQAQECGQGAGARHEARALWVRGGGEGAVRAHLAQYLARHQATNPHYARMMPD